MPADQPAPQAWPRRQVLLGLAGAACGSAWAQQAPSSEEKAPPPPALGSRLNVPDLTLLDGNRFRAADAKGQVLVLYWWASWCPFCAQQTPLMDKLWTANKARGLQLLGLSIDRKAEDASGYMTKRGYTFPAGLVTPASARVLPKPKGLPVTVVLGRDGCVLAAEVGQLFPEDIEQLARWL
jgi:thiol-disulfide isomerase/thioredoxin